MFIVAGLIGWVILMLLINILNKKPGLVITDKGITDNSGLWSIGEIPWSEISGIKEAKNEMQRKMFVIMLKNPEKYINMGSSTANDTRRKMYKQFGSPVAIAALGLKCDYQELKTILDTAFRKFGEK